MKYSCFILLMLFAFVSCRQKEPEQPVSHSKPAVTTSEVTDITAFTAVAGGIITSDGGAQVYGKGICYAPHPGPTSNDSVLENSVCFLTTFTVPVGGLKQKTTYYVRAFATNKVGVTYGNEVSFTTLHSELPEVHTLSVSEITQKSAVSGGDVVDEGTSPVTEKGICWSVSHMPEVSSSHTHDGTDTGSFASTLAGLDGRSTYFIRAYAINKNGTSYGQEVSVTTCDTSTGKPCEGIPTVEYQGKIYNTVQIGGKCWFKENLNVGTMIPGHDDMIPGNYHIEKYCYRDEERYCDQYGGLYQWDEAMQNVFVEGSRGICPLGWHIPTFSDRYALVSPYGGSSRAGKALKYNTSWYNGGNGTNLSGFTGLPAGIGFRGSYIDIGKIGFIWLSSVYDAGNAWHIILGSSNDESGANYDYRTLGLSVRCVKD